MNTWIVLISLAVVLSACSRATVPQRSRITSGERVTCKQQTPTGSHMPRMVCTSAAERAKQERDGQAMVEEERRRRTAEDTMRQTIIRRDPGQP